LPELTADDLISIGVTSVGHRRKLLAAIAALGTQPPTGLSQRRALHPLRSPLRQSTRTPPADVMFCDLGGWAGLGSKTTG
jgi:SAM domain (Sterile alpha motif)